MSVQFGRWNFDGQPCAPEYLSKVGTTLSPYGPDSDEAYSRGGVQILYRAFYTNKESRREKQPYLSPSGAVITWDGRLDNRTELISELRDTLTGNSTDVEIVAAAFERWGGNCFGKMIGDWALSIWNPKDQSLLLAKDPIGAGHLYYSIEDNHVVWSSTLDPLVLFAGKTFRVCEEYIAGWFSAYPATHLTPYDGIFSVPASCLVLIRQNKHTVSKYWDFDPANKVRYRTDAEYEEHFRAVFSQAVLRKLRSDAPVLAELSGGRDSSSIVCMADVVIAKGQAECPRLDTISNYDDSEPNWNERPYFTKVEEKRGRSGWHVNVGAKEPEEKSERESSPLERYVPAPNFPGYDGRTSSSLRACLASQGNRVVLSGIGGDEVLGGVPTPAPQLRDLLARAHWLALAHQLKVWALELRKPWFHLFWASVRDFFPARWIKLPKEMRPAPWLQRKFLRANWEALHGYPLRTKLFGPLPSFQGALELLDTLRRQTAQAAPPFDPPFEKRYPFLDRSLLEFLFAIPRDQLVRPTQRRSLMRRALVGIVPDEILNRKTKAFVARAPLVEVSRDWSKLSQMIPNMVSSSLGFVDASLFAEELQKARNGKEVATVFLVRTMMIEGWLRVLHERGIVGTNAVQRGGLAWQPSVQS